MKKYMKFLAAGMACALVAVSFSACGGGATEKKDLLAQIQERGEIVMATNAEFPPFEYVKDGSASVVGVDADIAQAIADDLGVKLKITDTKFDTIIPSIQSGKADLGIAGMTVTDERKQEVAFSDTYVTSVQYMIVNKDSNIKTVEDLKGKRIGVQLGTTGDLIMDEEINGHFDDDGNRVANSGALEGSGAKLVQANNAIEATQDLVNGKLDVVIIDKLPAESISKNQPTTKTFEMVYANGDKTDEQYAIAMSKTDSESLMEAVNKTLARLKAEGKIDEFIINHSK